MRLLIVLAATLAPFLSASAQSRLMVLSKLSASLELRDATTGALVQAWPTGIDPHEVAVAPGGRSAVVANYGAQTPGSTLTLVRLGVAGTTTIDLGAPSRPHGLMWIDSSRVLVTAEPRRAILIVDVNVGRVVDSIVVSVPAPHLIARDHATGAVYVTDLGAGSAMRIDVAKRTVERSVVLGRGVEGLAFIAGRDELWVASRFASAIYVLDARTLAVRDTVQAPGGPIRLAASPDGRVVVSSDAHGSTVGVFDVATRRRRGSIALAAEPVLPRRPRLAEFGESAVPIGIAVAADNRRAFVALGANDRVAELDLQTLTVVRTFTSAPYPDGLAIAR